MEKQPVAASVKLGINETVEAFDAVIGVVNSLVEAKSDGEITKYELLKGALANAPASVRGAIGADKIPAEMKDLDKSELEVIAGKGMELLQAIGKFMSSGEAA